MGQRFRILVLLLLLTGAGIIVGTFLARRIPEPSTDGASRESARIEGRIRVEVLNGSGVPGVARDATRILRDSGFDVVWYGNAETYSDDSSVVMDRVGALETATLVADALGIPRVRSEPDSTLFLEVTVRLGPDWTDPSRTQ